MVERSVLVVQILVSVGEGCESTGSGGESTEGVEEQRRLRSSHGKCHLDPHFGPAHDAAGAFASFLQN